jgi:hypothetical protein
MLPLVEAACRRLLAEAGGALHDPGAVSWINNPQHQLGYKSSPAPHRRSQSFFACQLGSTLSTSF